MARKTAAQKREDRRNALFVLPMACIAALLVALPLIYVLVTSLAVGGEGSGFTLAHYKALLRADYLKVFANSLKLALDTPLVSLAVG